MSTNRYSAIYALLSQLGWQDIEKEELVASYTGGSISMKDLSDAQIADMRTFLNGKVKEARSGDAQACDRIRKRIIAIAHQLGWYQESDQSIKLVNGRKVIDYERIDRYCIDHSAAHKAMNLQTKAELQKTVYQFQKMLDNYKKPIPTHE